MNVRNRSCFRSPRLEGSFIVGATSAKGILGLKRRQSLPSRTEIAAFFEWTSLPLFRSLPRMHASGTRQPLVLSEAGSGGLSPKSGTFSRPRRSALAPHSC